MRSPLTSLLLGLAVLAAVLATVAEAANLRDRLGLRVRAGKAVAKLDDLLKDAVFGGDTLQDARDAADRDSLKLLKHLYRTTTIDVTSGANLKGSAGVTDNMEGFDVKNMAGPVANELAAWIKRLRGEFPPGGSVHPKVQVRGGGPAGLAAALYARAGGAATVNVVELRSRYYRQHVVSTWKGKPLGVNDNAHGGPALAKVTPNGMEHLFEKIGLGLPNRPAKNGGCNVDSCAQYAVFHNVVPQERLADGRKIMVSDLERLLATVGHVVGVTFEYGGADAADPKRSEKRNSAWSAAITAFPQAAKCKAPSAAGAPHPNHADYDLLIGAEGARSATRAQYLAGSWVTPRCWTANKDADARPASLDPASKSDFIRHRGGLFSVGAVVKGSDYCNNKVGTAAVFSVVPADTGLAGAGGDLYRKPFTPDKGQDSYCQVELTFKEAAARHLKRAFGDDCGFNFNVLSGTEAKVTTPQISLTPPSTSALQPPTTTLLAADPELRHLVLVREVLKRVFLPNKVKGAFEAATEFKVWDNALRMSVATTDADAYRPLPLVHNLDGDRLVVVVGDALRDALPDSGMGVNDAHHMATEIGKIVAHVQGNAKVKNDNSGWAKPGVQSVLSGLAAHERNVVCALHHKMDLVEQPDDLAAQTILTAHDGLHKLVADALDSVPSTELTLSA